MQSQMQAPRGKLPRWLLTWILRRRLRLARVVRLRRLLLLARVAAPLLRLLLRVGGLVAAVVLQLAAAVGLQRPPQLGVHAPAADADEQKDHTEEDQRAVEHQVRTTDA